MNCSDARRLIDQGISPCSRSATQARLGFHLAQCPECQNYRETHTRLLEELLAHSPELSPSPTPTPPPARPESSATLSPRRHTRRWWLMCGVLLIPPMVALAWVVSTLVRTNQHLDAMIVTSELPTLSPSATTTPSPLPLSTESPSPMTTATEMATHTPIPPTLTPTDSVPPVPIGERGSWRPAATITPWPTIAPAATTTIATPASGELTMPPAATSAEQPTPDSQTKTILLLGHDLRPGEDDVPRTDAVMLMRVTTYPPRVALLSLPRDLWVLIPGYGMGRINEAYRFGELGYPGSGLAVASATVTNLTGIPIDHVILVGFEGFMGLIDTLGGVTLNVETELYDPQFPTMDYGYTTAHFLPGPQHMDGKTALTYSRTRHPDSDFVRIRRQQAMILAIVRRLHERGDFQNLVSIERITGSLVGFVMTDMSKEEIVGLLWAMRDFEVGTTEQYALGAEDVNAGVGNDLYALQPIPTVIDRVTRQFLGEPLPASH